MQVDGGSRSHCRYVEMAYDVVASVCLVYGKWKSLQIMRSVVLFGLVFDTQDLTVGITDELFQKVIKLILKHWYDDPTGMEAFGLTKVK